MADETIDPVADLLRKSPLSTAQRADLWDAYHQAATPGDLASVLTPLNVPKQVKASLWDLKQGSIPAEPKAPAGPSQAERAAGLLPTLGGFVGGIGGTMAGGPLLGVAGAATLGSVGEGIKQALFPSATPIKDTVESGALQGVMEGAGQAVGPIVGGLGRTVYRGYLKPSLAKTSINDAREIVDTALREALPITKQGVTTARTRIGELNAFVKDELAKAEGSVDLHQIADNVRTWARGQYHGAGTPPEDFAAAMKVADTIDQHPSLAVTTQQPVTKTVQTGVLDAQGQPITREVQTTEPVTTYRTTATPLEGQATKQRLDTAVGEGFGMERGATTEAQKRGRMEARQALERLAPSVGPANARQSQLIDAADAINRAVEREANNNMLTGVKIGASGLVGYTKYRESGDPWSATALALGARLALSPGVASRAALVASRLGRSMPGWTPAAIARVSILSALGSSVLDQQSESNAQPR